MARYINWHKVCEVYVDDRCEKESPDLVENLYDEMEDTLLFDMALHGRVPTARPRRSKNYSCYHLAVHFYCDVIGYYVGRAKAMKAYKTKNYTDYYLRESKFGDVFTTTTTVVY